MTNLKTVLIATLIVTASLAIFSFEGYSLNEIIAEEAGEDKGYKFAEDTLITGIFEFNGGSEISRFEVFTQKSGFQGREAYVFEMEKIVGDTPYLHKAADLSFFYRNSPGDQQSNTEFDVKIVISQGSEQKRAFQYSDCYVNDYSVVTLFDKEEGWHGKGFAVVDKFEFQCQVMDLINPAYEEMTSNKDESNGKSSIEYQKEQRHLFGN